MLLGRLSDEDEAFLRKFLKELLNIEPTKILIFPDEDRKRLQAEDMDAYFEPETRRIFVQGLDRGSDLEALMHEAIHMWKPNWSEENIEKAAQHLAEMFLIYEKEERKIKTLYQSKTITENELTSYLNKGWKVLRKLNDGTIMIEWTR